MNRFLGITLLYIFSHFSLCLKLHTIIDNKKYPYKFLFLRNNGKWTHKSNSLKKERKYHRVFYKNKKERDIMESGYLYPFDHLEKKKKQFPPDPYIPTEEDLKKNAEEDFLSDLEEELDRSDIFHYEDNDAKQYFGKTEFNRPEIIEENENENENENRDKDKDTDGLGTFNEYDMYMNIDETNESKEEFRMKFAKEAKNMENDSVIDKVDEIGEVEREKEKTKKKERELAKISVNFSKGNEIKAEMIKDQLHYLFHSCMDNIFNELYLLEIVACNNQNIEGSEIIVLYSNNQNIPIKRKIISSFSDLTEFYRKVKNILNEKIEKLHKKEMEGHIYFNRNERREFERNRKERKIINTSKNNLQMSIESSLRLIDKCNKNMYKQNFELTLQDLKLAYTMLPCKYYGYFLADLCAHISILSYYVNDLQSAFDFALKAVKYEPKYFLSWKCLGDSYRSFRKFWQAKNAYDIAIYLGYTDTKGENFKEIMKALNNLTKKALGNVDMLKENMNNHLHITVKKNIGIVINKNPDCIGGCYVSYIIEGGKAGKKSFQHGDQIVALNSLITFGKPIDFCLKAFQTNEGLYDVIFFKGNIIELYGLKAYKYLMENNLFSVLFENEKISSFKKNENILFDMRGFGTFSEYGVSKRGV